MKEASFNSKVNKGVKAAGPYALKLNLMYVAGVPDNWYSGCVRGHWSEFKWYSKLPTVHFHLRAGASPKLTAQQNLWLCRRYDEGRDVSVIVGAPDRCIVLLDKEWEHPVEVERMTMSHKDVIDWIVERVNGKQAPAGPVV